MSEGRYRVRRFDPERDIDAAYRCYVSGFYVNSWPWIDHAEPRLVKDMILACAGTADATFVAEVDGEARGVLVGWFPEVPRNLLRAARIMGAFGLRILARRYSMTPFARAAWWGFCRGSLSYFAHHFGAPAEVMMLNSQKEYRGGIGRAMMDAWVAEVRARGYDAVVVSTDSTVSWEFYERYGFERVRDFPLRSFFYSLPGVDVRGYIYLFKVPESAVE